MAPGAALIEWTLSGREVAAALVVNCSVEEANTTVTVNRPPGFTARRNDF